MKNYDKNDIENIENKVNEKSDNVANENINAIDGEGPDNNEKYVLTRIVNVNGTKLKLDFKEEFTMDDLLEKDDKGFPAILRILFPWAKDFKHTTYNGSKMYGIINKPAGEAKSAKNLTLGELKINGEFDDVVSDAYLLEKACEIKYGKEYVEKQLSDAEKYLNEKDEYINERSHRVPEYSEFAHLVEDNASHDLDDEFIGYGYRDAAKILVRYTDDKNKLNYAPSYREKVETDWNKKREEDNWAGKLKEFNDKVHQLENDYDFRLYISKMAADKKLSKMTEEEFVKGFEIHKQKMQDIYNGAVKPLDSYITLSGSDKKEELLTDINNTIRSTRNVDEAYKSEEMLDAANNIIFHTLKTKAAGVSFFSRVVKTDIDGEASDVLDISKTNELLNDMRKTLINDPVFRSLFIKNVSKKDFYNEYCSAINREINKDIKEENELKKNVDRDKSRKNEIESYMKDNLYGLESDKVKVITEVYNDLKEFNKGKSPSKYMERLMNSLEEVVNDIDDGNFAAVSMDKLDRLNKAALKYYDKRQGLIFSPLTDDGQSRLAAVARLVRTTNNAAKEIRAQYKASKKEPAIHK